MLAEVATELGARIQRGQRVTELTGLEDHVRVGTVTAEGDEHWMTSAYVVGCDGEQSTVRRVAGFELSGDAATRKMLRADVAGIEIPNRRFERHAHGLATAFRWPDGSTRVMVHVYGTSPEEYSNEPEYAEVAAAWAKVTGEDIRDGTPSWLNAFDDARWQVTEYRRGRVLLAGDAAHVQMPVGGQALNLGLQDAAELGGRLLERLTTRAGDEALDEYHRERAAVGSRTLTNIRAQALLLLGGPEVNPLRNLFTELMGFDSVQGHFARMISGKRVPEVPTRKVQKTISSVDRSFEMGRLNNKTALVTGASRGIGRATAMRLSEEGALVAVHYATNEAAARETVSSIEKNGGRAFPVRAELGASGDVHELFLGLEQGLKERTGDTTIDVVVNNAGETTPAGLAPEDVTPEQFDRLFAVNAKAPYFIVQRALNNLSDGGRVINISSGLTRFANPEQVAYSMSKGAIEQISLHFARHLASRRITVNTVAPGITNNGSEIFETPEIVEQMAQLSAFKRVGEAVDVADVVTFLASDEARWITGAFIDASGGTLLG
ncbi:NAD(P)-dependent dehydrogenase (short-subunit alcohol dehydrogenase family)/flavin-dependent dehydrogenase [Actinopolyspora biskrensis]|uniref:NAD(P)-dependent dehydrogenase (Short-subunit alcohol dehydrogenase family)/flavin-dependent dehydrogenase n=1 Tax=Actinopolyspora biskrensis TaxID=1470178 RepID=A0A852YVI9_9ACTN|nr:NAD(P)-dependent dehydrogenase (short-subunit alcohol dehydrogenase family)/flavin-dependent dehydrogenase [Actinopolyspora biskrensis]